MEPLNIRELSAVLAGLRLLQEAREAGALSRDIAAILNNGGRTRALSNKQIDALADRLNQDDE